MESKNLNESIQRLAEITKWFETQKEVDVEEGLKKVKEAVSLIKASKSRLKDIENEFTEIRRDMESGAAK